MSKFFPRFVALILLGATVSGVIVVMPQAFALPASTVATTVDPYGAGLNFDGYTCGASGLYWVFYNDGTNWGWRTSASGNSWSSEQTIVTSVPGNTQGEGLMAFYCNGSTVYYAGGAESASDDHVYYDVGTLNPSGTISWTYTPEQSLSTSYYYDAYPSITVDSNGYVWIAIQTQPQPTTGTTYLEIWNDGSGSWIQSSLQPGTGQVGQIVALQSGKMALIYGSNGFSPLSIRTFNGAGWNPTTVSLGSSDSVLSSSAVAIGSTIEICYTDFSNVYFASLAYGSASATPTTIASGANSCSISTDGIQNVAAFFSISTGTAVEEVQSGNGGATFGAPTVLSSVEAHVTSISASFDFSTSPAGQVPVVWMAGSTSPFSIRFANVAALTAVQESVTINPVNGGPTGAASLSGCSSSASSIPMDGLPHLFTASGSCAVTLTVPGDGSTSRYRFAGAGGGLTSWTYTTSASGSDVKSDNVYYQYLQTLSYTTSGGTGAAPVAPSVGSVEAGSPVTTSLTGGCSCWFDYGALWFVPGTITNGAGGYWGTSQATSGTVAGSQALAFAYSSLITTVTTTQTTTSTTTVTIPTTVTTTSTSTITITSTTASSTVTKTSTVTSTSVSTTTVSGSVPTSSSLSCDQGQGSYNRGVQCTDLIYTADNGTALGGVGWTASGSGSGTFSQQQCTAGYQGDYGGSAKAPDAQGTGSNYGQGYQSQQSQLVCQAVYTPSGSGVQTVTAAYSGDPYHGSSSSSFVVFAGNVSGSKVTGVSVACSPVYLTPSESTECVATVSAANGTPSGTVAWTATGSGSFAHVSCNGNGYGNSGNPLTCQATYTPSSTGEQIVKASYGGDASHTGSSGTFAVFIQHKPYADLERQAAVLVPTGLIAGSALGLVVMRSRKNGQSESPATEN